MDSQFLQENEEDWVFEKLKFGFKMSAEKLGG